MISTSVETLFDYIFSNQGMSRMILQESMARESVFREAAEKLFATMSRTSLSFWSGTQRKEACRWVIRNLPQIRMVAILFTTGIALLNTPVEDRDRHIEAAIVQLRMIMRGAEAMGQEA